MAVTKRMQWVLGVVVSGGAMFGLLTRADSVRAEDQAAEHNERCATRLSIALVGKGPTTDLLANANPQSAVDALLADPAFAERFARFANSQMNTEPGTKKAEDASYTLAKFVLANNKPWKEMFVGAYDVADEVTPDPNGLGYFRSDAWLRRYAGNEAAGYRISSAYRILQNTTGLVLQATTNVAGVDISATGRQAAGCRGCHYDNWYALDKVARVLSVRHGTGAAATFTPPADGPQDVLGGKTINNDSELVNALVDSTDFQTNVCRLAFNFLYARNESSCEADVFDRCMDAFSKDGMMQSAIGAIAKDPSFCQ